jgi:hypothetical protein
MKSKRRLSKNCHEVKLAELKARIRNATVFADVIDHFLDTLGYDSTFLNACVPEASGKLSEVLLQAVASVVGRTATLIGPVLRYRGTDFVHGAFFENGRTVIVLCFEKDALGIVGVVDPVSCEVKSTRFRLAERASACAAN